LKNQIAQSLELAAQILPDDEDREVQLHILKEVMEGTLAGNQAKSSDPAAQENEKTDKKKKKVFPQ
jgi:hypothetical protein